MKKYRVLFFNFLKELIREKIFFSLLLLATIFIISTLILNEMVIGEKAKATKDLAFSILNLFLLFYVLFVFITMLKREIQEKSVYFLLTRSVSRLQYLLIFFSAHFFMLLTGMAFIAMLTQLLLLLHKQFFLFSLGQAIFFNLLEGAILLTAALLFCMLTSTQLAMFLTLFFYYAAHAIQNAVKIVTIEKNPVLAVFLKIFYFLLPDLELYNQTAAISYQLPMVFSGYLLSFLYAFCWSGLLFFISNRLFNRLEL